MNQIIIPTIGFGKSGGYRVLSKIADELLDAGFKVSFVAPSYASIPYYSTKADIITLDVKELKINKLKLFCTLFLMFKYLRGIKNCIIIANQNLTAYPTFFSSFSNKKYYYIQAYELNISKGLVGKLLAYISYYLPLNKIVNSNVVLPKYLNRHLGVVEAGLDLTLFKQKAWQAFNNEFSVGIIGREELHKGTKEILAVLEDVVTCHPSAIKSINLAIYCPEIPEKLKHLVNFYPIVSDDELASFYRLNDIFIATGLVENGAFHYPCAEAMASGCLTISNYAPLSSSGSELFIKEFSVRDLKDRIVKSLAYDMETIRNEVKKNRLVIENDYSWKIAGTKMLHIIKNL